VEEQRAALKILLPDIGLYCERHGLKTNFLLQGLKGIPVDGRKVQAHCERLLMTRDELASGASVSRDMITKIINGKRDPTAAILLRLLRVLECTPGDLLLDEGNDNAHPDEPSD
jgi:DNA-binding Xre family transcriptional regulator